VSGTPGTEKSYSYITEAEDESHKEKKEDHQADPASLRRPVSAHRSTRIAKARSRPGQAPAAAPAVSADRTRLPPRQARNRGTQPKQGNVVPGRGQFSPEELDDLLWAPMDPVSTFMQLPIVEAFNLGFANLTEFRGATRQRQETALNGNSVEAARVRSRLAWVSSVNGTEEAQ
jgi:hypothetical protein